MKALQNQTSVRVLAIAQNSAHTNKINFTSTAILLKLLVLAIGILLLSSCNSLDRMIEKGNYDQALVAAARKMYGDKNKKTKHVQALEEAFAKATRDDLARAKQFEARGGIYYGNAIDIYHDIEDRQQKVLPFLPLISKDGYKANFEFVKVGSQIANARKELGQYYYVLGRNNLEKARRGDKQAARNAYTELKKAAQYKAFDNIQSYTDEAYALGITHIFVNLRNTAPVIISKQFENEILSISVADLNDTWRRFYMSPPNGTTIDINATLELRNIEIGPEREYIKETEETASVKDGWQYVLDANGQVLKDTLGKDVKEDRFVVVKALVIETIREKQARVNGQIRYTDARTGEALAIKPITVDNNFVDRMYGFVGDRRALCGPTLNNIGGHLAPFPTDQSMALVAAKKMKNTLKNDLAQYLR
jgi:hypothetical protein